MLRVYHPVIASSRRLRGNPVKNSVNQNFFIIFSGLPRRFAPRNDD
ncbi:hypothetical protein [Rickettsia hoogstraalii]|nr:hypothetical protein [Rickettsia hoogstraalii]